MLASVVYCIGDMPTPTLPLFHNKIPVPQCPTPLGAASTRRFQNHNCKLDCRVYLSRRESERRL